MSSAAPSRYSPLLGLLVLVSLVAAFGIEWTDTRRHLQDIELLRAEYKLLDQENRLLRQHLEAERLQSAALARLLKAASAPPASTPVSPAPSDTPQ